MNVWLFMTLLVVISGVSFWLLCKNKIIVPVISILVIAAIFVVLLVKPCEIVKLTPDKPQKTEITEIALVEYETSSEQPIYMIEKDGRFLCLKREGKTISDWPISTERTAVKYENTTPYLERISQTFDAEEWVWFVNEGKTTVTEVNYIYHGPEGSIVSIYDLD